MKCKLLEKSRIVKGSCLMRIHFLRGFFAGMQIHHNTLIVLEMPLFTFQCLFDPDCLKIHKHLTKHMQEKNKFRIGE